MQIETLKQPTDSQLDQLMAIWLAGNLAGHPFVKADYWRKQVPAVRAALPATRLLVATEADTIIGFLGLQGNYIAGIFVAATARKHGVGTALLHAAKAQQPKLQLDVYIANRSAVAFYHHSDFQVHTQTIDKATNQPEYNMRWHR